MEPIINIENISKSYTLRHEEQVPYKTLRDSLTSGVKKLWKGNVKKSMETFWALQDVSFQVQRGDRIGIIGRNGAGKSTLLKILSRITEPTRGRITIDGRVASLLEVGTGFHPELTGRENIFLNGSILGMSRQEIKDKFDEIVAFAEVERFLDTPVKRYSSGMYVRLAFAVAAHLEPEILIVDEVLAVGDAEFQKKCLGKMKEVTGAGRTILFVSHNMAAIQSLCNKVAFLKNGKLQYVGETETGLQHYIKSINTQEADLKERKDRKGNGSLRFEGFRLYNEQAELTPALQCGKDGILEIDLRKHIADSIAGLTISIGLDNEYGQRVVLLSNELTNQLFQVDTETFKVQVKLSNLALKPGLYNATLFAASGETIYDWIEGAGSIDVQAGDFFGSGKLPPSQQGYYFAPQDFRLK